MYGFIVKSGLFFTWKYNIINSGPSLFCLPKEKLYSSRKAFEYHRNVLNKAQGLFYFIFQSCGSGGELFKAVSRPVNSHKTTLLCFPLEINVGSEECVQIKHKPRILSSIFTKN